MITNKSLILPVTCDIKFYDNITGKSVNHSVTCGNHGFLFRESGFIQVSFIEKQTRHKYVCRSLWYTCINNVIRDYPISKYYCIFLDGKIFVLKYDDMLQIGDMKTSTLYITPMVTYDTMLDLANKDDVVVIDEMYVIDKNTFDCKTCAIKLNGLTFDLINDLPMTLSTYGLQVEKTTISKCNGEETIRNTDQSVRNSKMVTVNLVIDLDLNLPNDSSVMVPCDNFEYIEYSQGQHFSIHVDRKRNPMHTHAILIYPPTKTNLEGGELKLYPHGEQSMISITIKMSTDKWIGVIFPIDILHESLPIKNYGIKKILKTTGSVYTIC